MERICQYCGITKPIAAFLHQGRATAPRTQQCEACKQVGKNKWGKEHPDEMRALRQASEERNKDARREYQRAWSRNNPDKLRATKRRFNYGVDEVTYQAMWDRQQGCCAVCGKLMTLGLGRDGVTVDHNHQTHVVRDLLCRKCNIALGMAEDDPALLRKMADYLERHG